LRGLFTFSLLNTVELSNATRPLGSKPSVLGLISQSGNFLFSLFDEGEGESFDVRADNASSNRSSLSFSLSLDTISRSSGGKKELDSVVAEDSLLHGEAVFIKATIDPEHIALKLLSESIGLNFLSHALLEKDSASVVIIDIKGFGSAVGRV
jgi:hypothetical protein